MTYGQLKLRGKKSAELSRQAPSSNMGFARAGPGGCGGVGGRQRFPNAAGGMQVNI